MATTIRPILKKIKKGLQQIYGDQIDRILLYGSRARGEERPDSDIDILIVFKGEFNYS
jgi:predicted nucleotidyltransferase